MDNRKLKNNKVLVFDFDGTMCQLFKNYNLKTTLKLLHEKMLEFGIEFSMEKDSFDVFDEILKQVPLENNPIKMRALIEADNILTLAEVEAVTTGELVVGIERIFPYLKNKEISLGVATNNSNKCVNTFMQRYFPQMDIPVVGRVGDKPELMKPNAWSLLEVISKLNCCSDDVIFIGDTQRDYLCAKNVGCKFIGLAPTERKKQKLLNVISESDIVSDYYELVKCLGV